MALKLTNNAISTLAASVTSVATTLSVQNADAGKFPTLNAGDWCPATIIDAANNMEIVRVTARSGATLTITRAQEGTTAKAFAAGSRIDVRMTSAVIAELISLNDALTDTVNNNASSTATALGFKAPLSSPAFTDNPTTPTPTAGDASTTIPNTGWVAAEIATAIGLIRERFSQKSANYTAVKADNATSFMYTSAATHNLDAAATLNVNWWCEVWAVGGRVTIDPNGSETVDGRASTIVQPGQMARIFCNGTAFFTEIVGDPLSGPQNQGFLFGLNLSTNATDATNDIDVSVGAAAADTAPYALMQLATVLTKRIDAPWAVGNNAGGLDTGTVAANGTYYLYEIQRSDTLVTDAIYSLSSAGPLMPTNYDRKRLLGVVVRTAGVNAPPNTVNARVFESANQTYVINGPGSVAHGLGYKPNWQDCKAVCIADNNGWVTGEDFDMASFGMVSSAAFGIAVWATVTTINWRVASAGLPLISKSTGNIITMPTASWALRFKGGL